MAELEVMLASERGRRPFAKRDEFWIARVAADRVIAFALDRFWSVDSAGVVELPPPQGVGSIKPYTPSQVQDGTILLFSHSDMEDEAFLYEIDLAGWKSTRQTVSTLLRGPRGAAQLWMPLRVDTIFLRDQWVLLNISDQDPLNRIACWLWDRSTNRAWGRADTRARG